ncbi:uncharacterized protein JCM6883_000975 [Sporobolomyces salmoneus]|uniref:uncharacterized protein n=1 Tax=Sporobolomyces salmoneus TaxID=183962 RepID=UPI003181918E
MSAFTQKQNRRAVLEKAFFLSNRPVLSTEQLGAFGTLQVPLLKELASRCDLILASREETKVHLVFPTPEASHAAAEISKGQNIELKPGPSPLRWSDHYGLDQRRTPFDRFYFKPFMDLTADSPSHAESDAFIHTFWVHNFTWYNLTRQIRSCAPGFFVVQSIQSQVERFLRNEPLPEPSRFPPTVRLSTNEPSPSDESEVEELDEGPVAGEEQGNEGDETLVEEETLKMSLQAPTAHSPIRQPSPKREPTSPPSSALPPVSKRPRSADPFASASTDHRSLLELPTRPASALPSTSIPPARTQSPSIPPTPLRPVGHSTLSPTPIIPGIPKAPPAVVSSSSAVAGKAPPSVVRASSSLSTSSVGATVPHQLLDRSTLLPKEPSDKLKAALATGPIHTCLRYARISRKNCH